MKNKHYLILGISVFLILQSLVPASSALVNQAIVNSSYSFDNFTESNCRGCHSSGVPDRHHILTYSCMDCHPVATDSNGEYTMIIIRDCTQCHGSTFNNLTIPLPHKKCSSCHVDNAYNIPNISVIDRTAFSQGGHVDINSSDGSGQVNDSDCWTCHFNRNMNISNSNVNRCKNCHTGAGQFGAPIVSEHNENGTDIKTAATCILCHSNNGMYLNNNGTNGTTSAVVHYIKNITNTAAIPYQHLGPLNTSDCIVCHNGAYTNNISWGAPVNISTSPKRNHTETRTSQCDLCHKDSNIASLALVDFHNASLQGSDMNNCLGCHNTVTSSDLGLHSGLNGTTYVDNGDCKTCHFGSFPMVKGAVNNSNTYFCFDCHNNTAGGKAPAQYRSNNASRNFNDKKHAKATCIDCHVADGRYHQGNPRGSIANATYASRDSTNRSTYTECGDCHSMSNLDDSPFYAPGAGSHANGSCANGGGCHLGGNSVVLATHNTNPLDAISKKPTISTPTLDHSTVPRGTDVNINVTVNLTLSPAYANALVDGAQYRINNSDNTVTIQSWTPMVAFDGNFNSIQENATGRINTSTLSGTYNIEVRGMAGGPAQNTSERYYPMNGDVSTTKVITLTVQPPMGYINGTVNSGGVNLSGVTITTAGASDITKSDGSYSLKVSEGTYSVTASKQPTHNDKTITGVDVIPGNTTFLDVDMTSDRKPTGTISGTVTNV